MLARWSKLNTLQGFSSTRATSLFDGVPVARGKDSRTGCGIDSHSQLGPRILRWDTPRPSNTRPTWASERSDATCRTCSKRPQSGLFDIIVANRADVRDLEQESVTLASDSTEDLMLAWLNELIFRCETRHRFYSRFTVAVDESGRSLQATIAGEPIDAPGMSWTTKSRRRRDMGFSWSLAMRAGLPRSSSTSEFGD